MSNYVVRLDSAVLTQGVVMKEKERKPCQMESRKLFRGESFFRADAGMFAKKVRGGS